MLQRLLAASFPLNWRMSAPPPNALACLMNLSINQAPESLLIIELPSKPTVLFFPRSFKNTQHAYPTGSRSPRQETVTNGRRLN